MTELPTGDARSRLIARLTAELHDAGAVRTAVADLDDAIIELIVHVTAGDIESSPVLSCTFERAPDDAIGSLWLFSWGYRIDSSSGFAPVDLLDQPPPIEVLQPGPVNAAIARCAAEFLARRRVPVIAQWEVARELEPLGIVDVIAIDPEIADDGEVRYLSTPDVITEGLARSAELGIEIGIAGIITFDALAVGGVTAMRAAGVPAAVPAGCRLPDAYDPESGQLWTRSLEAWLPVDLFGRCLLAGDPDT
jgi:hypothetical protein